MGKMDETIIVVPTDELFSEEHLYFNGVQLQKENTDALLYQMGEHYTTMRRGDAEENEAFKQPIPYVVVKHEDEVFVYERLAAGGEARLHHKWSIGVGGHQNPSSTEDSFLNLLEHNMLRELEEELTFDRNMPYTLTPIGLINDDEDEVGRVHIGILFVLEMTMQDTIEVREKEVLRGSWLKISEAEKQLDRFESWSQFAIQALK
ncbi:hypothetical protein G4V62_07955 [Bacillaceae bacterium SIJ1]|uniref:hypothetical protein n=1 Tax=Litoribacterium kuwaitense TaxID=1398745 RepID=UPI0013EBF1DE|nr:hypothetical protein [Litoribacterium kuwaitense]NGP44895.1 hypothetical protein [Litoribacterium kuwaitense]